MTEEVKTITINDRIYNIEDLSKDALNLVNDVTLIQNTIKDKNTEIAVYNIARETLMTELLKEIAEVNSVPTEAPTEAPAEATEVK